MTVHYLAAPQSPRRIRAARRWKTVRYFTLYLVLIGAPWFLIAGFLIYGAALWLGRP